MALRTSHPRRTNGRFRTRRLKKIRPPGEKTFDEALTAPPNGDNMTAGRASVPGSTIAGTAHRHIYTQARLRSLDRRPGVSSSAWAEKSSPKARTDYRTTRRRHLEESDWRDPRQFKTGNSGSVREGLDLRQAWSWKRTNFGVRLRHRRPPGRPGASALIREGFDQKGRTRNGAAHRRSGHGDGYPPAAIAAPNDTPGEGRRKARHGGHSCSSIETARAWRTDAAPLSAGYNI